MVEREPNRKRYRPTALVSSLSVGYQLEDILTSIAWPVLAEMTERLKWPMYISTKVGPHMVVKLSTDALTTMTFTRCYPGYTTPLLEAPSGKAYLAFSNERHRDTILGSLFDDSASGYEARLHVENELELTRKRGYAAAKCLTYTEEPGRTSGISVPITLPGEQIVLATLSLIFFSSSMTTESAAAAYLHELEHAVGYIVSQL